MAEVQTCGFGLASLIVKLSYLSLICALWNNVTITQLVFSLSQIHHSSKYSSVLTHFLVHIPEVSIDRVTRHIEALVVIKYAT